MFRVGAGSGCSIVGIWKKRGDVPRGRGAGGGMPFLMEEGRKILSELFSNK